MGKTNVYKQKQLMAVRLGVPSGSTGTIKPIGSYGFMTNLDAAESSQLGHYAARTSGSSGNYIPSLIIGGDAPRPAKLRKKTLEYTVTSYVGYDKVNQALAQGWKKAGNIEYRAPRQTKNSKLVFISIRGIKYAWRMRTEQYAKLQAFASNIGFKDASANDTDLVYGPSFPKPPTIGIVISGEGGTDSLSTFCDPTKVDSLREGWFLKDPGNYAST
ncbi:hypothetical protein [Laspinema olomoucense]|uniref:hypothetical protein n=1 Tax=Laspinema olomoucense TaxID=3231600 RepID=UPI0021BB1B14|nr:hypothetical protein [Laspinema sp. D3d]MCT7971082.1 hypothetical protein [Laspinema sp. D3d]